MTKTDQNGNVLYKDNLVNANLSEVYTYAMGSTRYTIFRGVFWHEPPVRLG